jgi:integrase
MPRAKNKRAPGVAITPSGNQWVGFVTVGRGQRRKRASTMCASCRLTPKVGCACYEMCADKIRELEDQVAARKVPKAGRPRTLGEFLAVWLEGMEGQLEHLAFVDYRAQVRRLAASPLAGVEVPDVDPTSITRFLKRVGQEVSATTAHKVWRVLRSALSDYEREHPSVRNMARLAKPPKLDEKEVVPFTVPEVQRIFSAIDRRGARCRARWYVAIAGGLRQGEALGLSWHRLDAPDVPPDIDLDAGVLTVREKQYRRTWEHGCDNAVECVRQLHEKKPWIHKTRPCPATCTRHARKPCPPPCPVNCTDHASVCPDRKNGGLRKGKPKNKKERSQALAAPVVVALAEWKDTQDAEKEMAGSVWVDSGRVFTQALGQPIDSRRDWGELQEILVEAGVHQAGVHATRHTTATFLRLLKVDPRIVMGQMGWSTSKMAERYEHFGLEMSQDAADAMEGLLWPVAPTHTDPEPDGERSATSGATVTDLGKFRQRQKASRTAHMKITRP